MARKPKKYEDDDGRVIADMSGLSRPSLFRPGKPAEKPARQSEDASEQEREDRPWEETEMSREDRRAYIWAALKAALAVAAVYIVVLGLLIAFLLWLWT